MYSTMIYDWSDGQLSQIFKWFNCQIAHPYLNDTSSRYLTSTSALSTDRKFCWRMILLNSMHANVETPSMMNELVVCQTSCDWSAVTKNLTVNALIHTINSCCNQINNGHKNAGQCFNSAYEYRGVFESAKCL